MDDLLDKVKEEIVDYDEVCDIKSPTMVGGESELSEVLPNVVTIDDQPWTSVSRPFFDIWDQLFVITFAYIYTKSKLSSTLLNVEREQLLRIRDNIMCFNLLKLLWSPRK